MTLKSKLVELVEIISRDLVHRAACVSYLILDVMFTVSARLNVPGCVIAVIGGGEYDAGRIEYIIVGLCCTFCISTLITYCIAMCYIFIVIKSHIRSKAGCM